MNLDEYVEAKKMNCNFERYEIITKSSRGVVEN